MKKLLLTPLVLCLIVLLQAADEWPSPERSHSFNRRKSEGVIGQVPCCMIQNVLQRPTTASPSKILNVQDPKGIDVEFDDKRQVFVPSHCPFKNLELMMSGPGKQKHRFDPLYLRDNRADALQALVDFYNNKKLFINRLYQGDLTPSLNDLFYLAGFLGAQDFTNEFYISLLNHPNNQEKYIEHNKPLVQVLPNLGIQGQFVFTQSKIALQSFHLELIDNYQ